jgi:hypothetical protein
MRSIRLRLVGVMCTVCSCMAPVASPPPAAPRTSATLHAQLVDAVTRALHRPDPAQAAAVIERARRADPAARPGAETLGDLGDSIAILDAYFAFCNGDRARMHEAAQRVHVATDDDVEDLYLVQLAFSGAGDPDAATAVRKLIAQISFVTVLTPVFLTWMRTDDAAGAAPHAFSPKFPTGARHTH